LEKPEVKERIESIAQLLAKKQREGIGVTGRRNGNLVLADGTQIELPLPPEYPGASYDVGSLTDLINARVKEILVLLPLPTPEELERRRREEIISLVNKYLRPIAPLNWEEVTFTTDPWRRGVITVPLERQPIVGWQSIHINPLVTEIIKYAFATIKWVRLPEPSDEVEEFLESPQVQGLIRELALKPKIPTWVVIAGIGVVVLGGYLLLRKKR